VVSLQKSVGSASHTPNSFGKLCYKQLWQAMLPTALASYATNSFGKLCYKQLWQAMLQTALASYVTMQMLSAGGTMDSQSIIAVCVADEGRGLGTEKRVKSNEK